MKTSRSTYAGAALLVLSYPLLSAAQTQQPVNPGGWPGPWHMWYGGWGFGWWIFPLFMFLMMLVCFGVFFFGHSRRSRWGPWQMMGRPSEPGRPWGNPTYSALEILNERFAKGEIEKQEYEEKRAAILSRGQA